MSRSRLMKLSRSLSSDQLPVWSDDEDDSDLEKSDKCVKSGSFRNLRLRRDATNQRRRKDLRKSLSLHNLDRRSNFPMLAAVMSSYSSRSLGVESAQFVEKLHRMYGRIMLGIGIVIGLCLSQLLSMHMLAMEVGGSMAEPQSATVQNLHRPRITDPKLVLGAGAQLSPKVNDDVGKFAYCYVIGGIMPEDELSSYRHYLYNIMVSTRNQRMEGSTADVIVYVQISFDSSHETLPEEALLNSMDIHVKYIPKNHDESFYRLMLEKFRILSLVEYDRVMYMDADVMAWGSLDYLFELSMAGVLKENIVFTGDSEPAEGTAFVLSPSSGATERLLETIRAKEERSSLLPYPHWDKTVGWGHEIQPEDYYELLDRGRHRDWGFYGAFADQGLLYHWVKYEEKAVSVVIGDQVQNWQGDTDGSTKLEEVLELEVFEGLTVPRRCWVNRMERHNKPCHAPHSDMIHFVGHTKPWELGPSHPWLSNDGDDSPVQLWFSVLRQLNSEFALGLQLEHDTWQRPNKPSLGKFPNRNDATKSTFNTGLLKEDEVVYIQKS